MDFPDLAAIFSALIVLVSYGLILFFLSNYKKNKEQLDLKRRLGDLTISQKEIHKASLIKEPTADSDSFFKSKLPKVEGLTQWIQHSGFNINPFFFVEASILLGLISFFIIFFLLKIKFLFCFLSGVLISFIVPWSFISFFTIIQKKKFLEELPTALDMIQRALKAGYSSEKAIEMVSLRTSGPIGKVFQQISEKMTLGESPEAVLADLSNQVGIDEFRMLSIVLILQRETGGGLAEAVENFSKIIRARQNLKKKVKALTGEVRATAIILTSIPFVISGVIISISPQYLDPLFFTPRGHVVLFIGGGMLTLGIAIIFRMAYKDIY